MLSADRCAKVTLRSMLPNARAKILCAAYVARLKVYQQKMADRHSVSHSGLRRTYWDFYFGFGLVMTGYLALQAVVRWNSRLWQEIWPPRYGRSSAVFFLAFAVNAIVVWMYFFLIPLAFPIAITICLALAFVFARPQLRSGRKAHGIARADDFMAAEGIGKQ